MSGRYYLFPALILLFMAAPGYSQLKEIRQSGDNFLKVGQGLPVSILRFSKVTGDWFSTSKESHVVLRLDGHAGNYRIVLETEWSGTGKNHLVDRDNDNPVYGYYFLLSLNGIGSANPDFFLQPDQGHTVMIRVEQLDATRLVVSVTGSATYQSSSGKSLVTPVNGRISLVKPASVALSAGAYRDCDSIIHDQLAGAEFRSPSGCEVIFDHDVRQAIQSAFEPSLQDLENNHFRISAQPVLNPITGVARHSEKTLYQINNSDAGSYRVSLSKGSFSTQLESIASAYDVNSHPGQERQLDSAVHQLQADTRVSIQADINVRELDYVDFDGAFHITRAPGLIMLGSGHVQVPTGGGREASTETDFIFLGDHGQPLSRRSGAGETVTMKAVIRSGVPRLSLQNIVIRLDCSHELAKEILGKLDLSPVKALMNR